MTDKKRLTIIIASVIFGTVISAALFFLRRGGNITTTDFSTLATNMAYSLVIVIVIGVFLGRKKNKN